MKKLFRNLMLVAVAALGVASCDDVPAPFVEPGGGDEPGTSAGGTWDAPFTVAELVSNQTGDAVWVHGYIVGSIPADAASFTLDNMTFAADGASGTNVCIAESPDETNYSKCVPVQLPAGSDARALLNLQSNPTKLGAEIWLKGTSEKYFGSPGMKNVSKFTLVAPTADDDKEAGGDDTPAEGAKGDGSLENPFNAAAALNYTQSLPADQATSEKFYVKGIVCESSKMDISTQYKNATFHISEDGTASTTQFLIFRTKGLNGADITSADDVQVGDEVVVYASLVNYKGNTPETAQGGIIYAQKRNGVDITPGEGGDNGEGEGGGNDGGDVPAGANIFENGDFEQWVDGAPLNWKSASSAGNVTVEQSTEAHGGSYAVSMVGVEKSNKRLAYKETTLAAGTYKFSFYAKGTVAGSKCQTRPGYVPMKADGTIDSSNYKYGSYVTLSATDWTLIEHEFTLDAETTICTVIMAPKASDYHDLQNILVDDASLVKIK